MTIFYYIVIVVILFVLFQINNYKIIDIVYVTYYVPENLCIHVQKYDENNTANK